MSDLRLKLGLKKVLLGNSLYPATHRSRLRVDRVAFPTLALPAPTAPRGGRNVRGSMPATYRFRVCVFPQF